VHVIDRSTYVLVSVLSAGPDAVQCVTIDADVGVVVCGTANGRVAAWQVSLCTVVPVKQVNCSKTCVAVLARREGTSV
jgi:hypothetical protein